jgi:hypothetical protein
MRRTDNLICSYGCPGYLLICPEYWYYSHVTFEFLGYTFRFAGTRTLSPERHWITSCANPLTAYVTFETAYQTTDVAYRPAAWIDMGKLWSDGVLASSQTFRIRARGSGSTLGCKLTTGATTLLDLGDIWSNYCDGVGCGWSEGSTWHSATVYDDGSVA